MKIPVILDTDIGSDIDDTWALAMMLKSPELDVKLIVSDTDDTEMRAAIVCKLLEAAGRTDIPVGIGIRQSDAKTPQTPWVDGYDLGRYPGTILRDGVGAICDTIMSASEPVRLVCIGPVPNIASALSRVPAIAGKAHFVGMHGSVRHAGEEGKAPIAEYNVKRAPGACRLTFCAPWLSRTITPLDTCATVRLKGERYRRILACKEPLTRAVIEGYRVWAGNQPSFGPDSFSSILFDTVAIHLAMSTRFLVMEKMNLTVTDDAMTVPDPGGPMLNVASSWSDLEAYGEYLTERMLAPVVR